VRERDRIVTRLGELQERDGRLATDMDRLRDDIHRLDAGEATLAEVLDVAEAKLHSANGRLEGVREETRRLGSQRAAQLARAEALHAAATDATRSAEALVAAGLAGVHGSVMDLLEVDAADRIAVATALGPLGAAIAVDADDALTRAVDWLRRLRGRGLAASSRRDGDGDADARRASRRAARAAARGRRSRRPRRRAREPDVARRSPCRRAVGRALRSTFLVDDWDTAVRLHAREPQLTLVTRDGDVAGPLGYRVGRSAAPVPPSHAQRRRSRRPRSSRSTPSSSSSPPARRSCSRRSP
jgi:chromosome segregation protein